MYVLSQMCRCMRTLYIMLAIAAQRKRPRASGEFPAAVTTTPCLFYSSARGGCNAGPRFELGREKGAYIIRCV